MVFSSVVFLFYFLPVFLTVYFLAPKSLKNPIILVGSMFFYAWGAPRFIFVILGTTLVDFYIVRAMDNSPAKYLRKLLLTVSLSINLGLLFYFKYSNFFVDNLNFLLQTASIRPVAWMQLVLPIGISFYTFETITYVVDVYRKVHKPLRNFWDYQLYIILFPKLIAGPIVRYHDIAGQLYDRSYYETAEYRLRGMYRFAIGLGKKVLIANVLGSAVDSILNVPANTQVGTCVAWIGALSYTFQIYFDFSGYSDMAIGLCLMMGFRIPENFNSPYTATSITDFWRRWHISLGNWMRNYLYIPLGGNRGKQWRVYLNLALVFLASGLWHGAAWGFVIWGAYHGSFLIIERLFLLRWLARIGKAACIYTFVVVLSGWVFFRLVQFKPSIAYLKTMFIWQQGTYNWHPANDLYFTLATAAFFSFFTLSAVGRSIQEKVFFNNYTVRRHYLVAPVAIILIILAAARITSASFNPFIYFRF